MINTEFHQIHPYNTDNNNSTNKIISRNFIISQAMTWVHSTWINKYHWSLSNITRREILHLLLNIRNWVLNFWRDVLNWEYSNPVDRDIIAIIYLNIYACTKMSCILHSTTYKSHTYWIKLMKYILRIEFNYIILKNNYWNLMYANLFFFIFYSRIFSHLDIQTTLHWFLYNRRNSDMK